MVWLLTLGHIAVGLNSDCNQDRNLNLRIKPSIIVIEKGLQTNRLVVAYLNRSNAYADKGQYNRAIVNFDLAIALYPNDALAHYNRGNAYF